MILLSYIGLWAAALVGAALLVAAALSRAEPRSVARLEEVFE